jgi:hypothetical protein
MSGRCWDLVGASGSMQRRPVRRTDRVEHGSGVIAQFLLRGITAQLLRPVLNIQLRGLVLRGQWGRLLCQRSLACRRA